MQDNSGNDVNIGVMGTGCGTSCGAGCVSVLLVLAVIALVGVQAARQSQLVVLLGFFAGLLVPLIAGYVTARAAREKNVAVNFHVILVGALVMLVGLLAWVLPAQQNAISAQTQGLALLLRVVSWLLTIPLMLLGASWSADDAE